MATDITQTLTPQTLDLSGLPESVVRDIRRLVETLRVKLGSAEARPPTTERRPLRGIFTEPGFPSPGN